MAALVAGSHNPNANKSDKDPKDSKKEKKAIITNDPARAFKTSFLSQERAIKETIEALKNNKGLITSPRRKLNAMGNGVRNRRRSMKKRTRRCIFIQVNINDYHSRVIVLKTLPS